MKKIIISCLFIFISTLSIAQVEGISYTLVPTASYQKWDGRTGVKDGALLGAQLGFGFGQNLELKVNYQEGLNLKRDFSNLSNYVPGSLTEEDVKFKRWGGDFKINIARGDIVPYIAVGTGLQSFKVNRANEEEKNQIYFTGAAGVQFSLSDRFSVSFSLHNSYYKFDPYQSLLNDEEKQNLGIESNNETVKTLNNWSVNSGLIIYLGGYNQSKMSAEELAFQEKFSNGFKGLNFPISIESSTMDFSEKLPFTDTKFTTLNAGLNFGQFVGFRGFYGKSMSDGYFSSLGNLSMYGAEAYFKLSEGLGIFPTLTIGGGIFDPLNGYRMQGEVNGENGVDIENTNFVSSGVSLTVPFSKYFNASVFGKVLATTSNPSLIETDVETGKIQTSLNYGLALNFILGRKSSNDNKEEKLSDYDRIVNSKSLSEEQKSQIEDLDSEIEKTTKEINEAYTSGDNKKLVTSYNKRKELEEQKMQVSQAQVQNENLRNEDIIALLKDIKTSNALIQNQLEISSTRQAVEIENLKKQIEEIKGQKSKDQKKSDKNPDKKTDEVKDIENKLGLQGDSLNVSDEDIARRLMNYNNNYAQQRKLVENRLAGYSGFNFGGAVAINVGIRDHFQIKESNFYFMPEAYFGLTSPFTFGLFSNFIYMPDFSIGSTLQPYGGLGVGLMKVGQNGGEQTKTIITPNIILGLNIMTAANGNLFVEYSNKSFFKYNQIILGYRVSLNRKKDSQ